MSKGIKLVSTFLVGTLSLGIFGGCSKENSVSKMEQQREGVSFTYEDGKNHKVEIQVQEPPKKAITLSQFMTEMLLALGLEDKMVGTALLDNEILPEFKEAYEKIPVLEMGEQFLLSKEAFVSTGADFVSGWNKAISEESMGSAEELNSKGVVPFLAKSVLPGATMETVYEDFRTLGKIFAVEEKAEEVISKMKSEIAQAQSNIKTKDTKPKVMVYDSGEKEPMVVGGGLPNELITLAGGENIYGQMKKAYENVSFESIVEKNPDVILINDYLVGIDAKKKIDFLKNHPALKEVTAIKNNNIHIINLADLSPGVRNSKVIKKINEILYK